MERDEFIALLPDPKVLIEKIQKERITDGKKLQTYLAQYDPKKHNVFDNKKRPDKMLETEQGPAVSPVTRLAIPAQKQIVHLAVSFLCGNPIELNSNASSDPEKEMVKLIRRAWTRNKLDFDSKAIAEKMMSETECAELWYAQKDTGGFWQGTSMKDTQIRFRMKILSNSDGDSLYPVFDSFGDMIAFGRGYTVTRDGKTTDHFDIYTDEVNYFHEKNSSGWLQTTSKNQLGKLPVIYYRQPLPEWDDVQEMIDRLEEAISNLGDTNDYFGSPIVFVQGKINGFAAKGERGKVIEGEPGSNAQYLSWNQSPESTKLEFTTLRSFILDFTSTPDISIEQMKALGTYSGVALKMLFLAAHLKAARKEETFGKSIQRRINFLMSAITKINPKIKGVENLEVSPKFEYYLPKNIAEVIEFLSTATGGQPILSQETAVQLNPLVEDAEKELQAIKVESKDKELTNPL